MKHHTKTGKVDHTVIHLITGVLNKDERVVFAYLYGSAMKGENARDVDIAVYSREGIDPYELSSDLKVSLHFATGFPPDIFDVRVLNGLQGHCDIFGLLYLKSVLSDSILLVDKDPKARGDFIETYGFRYRECEGLMQELLA